MGSKDDQKGNIVIISGPSGVGKSTICSKLVQRSDDVFLSVSATTRPKGKTETNGKDYWFITKEEFQRRIDEGDFLEYAEVFENYYGTPRSDVENAMSQGRTVILEIDIQGALQVRDVYPEAIMIFILPPQHSDLLGRMNGRARGENDEATRQRLNNAGQEIASAWQYYKHMVVNADVDQAVKDVEQIIIENSRDKK